MSSSDNPALRRFLERLLLRSHLADEEQQALLHLRNHASQAAAHRDIVSPGQKVEYACLVVDGLAGRFDQMADGRRQTTAIHLPGDMCDLHSVIAPTAAWGIAALTTTTVLHIPHSDLRALATSYPAIAMAFWRDTTADASILAKWTSNLGRRNALSRLSHLLCELGMRMEMAGLGARTSYALPMTQEQLSDALGLTAVHVNRTLQLLRKEGIARAEHRRIQITDWDQLVSIADFQPDFLLLQRNPDPIADPEAPKPSQMTG